MANEAFHLFCVVEIHATITTHRSLCVSLEDSFAVMASSWWRCFTAGLWKCVHFLTASNSLANLLIYVFNVKVLSTNHTVASPCTWTRRLEWWRWRVAVWRCPGWPTWKRRRRFTWPISWSTPGVTVVHLIGSPDAQVLKPTVTPEKDGLTTAS